MKKLLLILMAFVAMSASAQTLKDKKMKVERAKALADLPKADLSLQAQKVVSFQQAAQPAQLLSPKGGNKRALAPMKAPGDVGFYSMITGSLDDDYDENGQKIKVEAVHDGVWVGLLDIGGDSLAIFNMFEDSFQSWGLTPLAVKTEAGFTINHNEIFGYWTETLSIHAGLLVDVVGNSVIMGDAEFLVDEDGYVSLKERGGELMLYVADEDGNFQGYIDYLWSTALVPESELGDIIPMPDNAEEYLFTYTIGSDGTTQKIKGKVGKQQWEDEEGEMHTLVYVQGLTRYSNGVVYGFEQGNQLFLVSGVNLGRVGYQYLQFAAATQGVDEETGEDILVDPGYVTFTKGSDGTYTQESGVYILEQSPLGYVTISAAAGVTFAPYEGDELAKPKAPHDLEIVEGEFQDGTPVDLFCFTAEYEGTRGEFLDPNNLYYEIWMDDDRMTFTAEDYPYDELVVERGTSVPFLYDGYYVMYDSNIYSRIVALFGLYEKVGVRMVYCCYGEERYSDLVYVDSFDGTVTTADGIDTVLRPAEQPVGYYDLSGRRVARIPAKGLFIKDGKKVLK